MNRQGIGILGGTFDPVHNGHLTVAGLVLKRLKLHRILFIPAARPPHKHSGAITPFSDRAAMLAVALADNPCFELCALEENRPGPSYSIDTLRELRKIMPAADLYFIIGLDAFAEITSWKEWQGLPELASLVVINRSGIKGDDSSSLIPRLFPGYREEKKGVWTKAGQIVYFLDMEPVPVSSTEIRAEVRAGKSIRGLLPPAVEDYIYQQRLYR